ncbi:hypothetical protein AgCh_007140 [Apium graveolens]
MKRNFVVYSSIPPDPSISSGGLPGGLPEQIESAVQTVEDIVEAVEDVAEKVDKFAEGIIEDLPEGEFKTALGRIEHVAEKVAKDAKQIDNAIDKVNIT